MSNRTAIISLHDDNYRPMADVVESNFQEYADKWGHDLKIFRESLDTSRHTYWSKILAVKQTLEYGYDTVFWCDIDSVFVDFTQDIVKQLEESITNARMRFDLGIGHGHINQMERVPKDDSECFYSVSQMAWIYTEESIKFLDVVYGKTKFLGHIWPEQMAVIETMREIPGVSSSCFVKIINPFEYLSQPQGFGGFPIATLCGGTGVIGQKIACLKKMLSYVRKS